MPHPPTRN
ncbi:hypothetical protein E2C01_100613 [Portunus trituberculatus]|uniref:Uncharacterized protein n=1 Tax=Portunus trituberculatus TaxID=210409 RepID=A0A5B7K3K6_PORTR|nr:hypothetical protein [Portunus trituberculatus]